MILNVTDNNYSKNKLTLSLIKNIDINKDLSNLNLEINKKAAKEIKKNKISNLKIKGSGFGNKYGFDNKNFIESRLNLIGESMEKDETTISFRNEFSSNNQKSDINININNENNLKTTKVIYNNNNYNKSYLKKNSKVNFNFQENLYENNNENFNNKYNNNNININNNNSNNIQFNLKKLYINNNSLIYYNNNNNKSNKNILKDKENIFLDKIPLSNFPEKNNNINNNNNYNIISKKSNTDLKRCSSSNFNNNIKNKNIIKTIKENYINNNNSNNSNYNSKDNYLHKLNYKYNKSFKRNTSNSRKYQENNINENFNKNNNTCDQLNELIDTKVVNINSQFDSLFNMIDDFENKTNDIKNNFLNLNLN